MKKVNKMLTSGAVITSLGLTVGATSHSVLADEVQQASNATQTQENANSISIEDVAGNNNADVTEAESPEVPDAEQPSEQPEQPNEPESPEVPDAEQPSEMGRASSREREHNAEGTEPTENAV